MLLCELHGHELSSSCRCIGAVMSLRELGTQGQVMLMAKEF